MAFLSAFNSTALLAQDMAEVRVSSTFENGVAEIDLSETTFEDISTIEFIYGNESDCDYRVFFSFDVSGTCTACPTGEGPILAGTQDSFTYCPPLTNCSGTVPCSIRIVEDGNANNYASSPGCDVVPDAAEVETSVGCTGSPGYNVSFYYCGEIRIYE